MEPVARCHRCDGTFIQRSRARLFVVGLLLSTTPLFAVRFAPLWIPTVLLALAGAYLIVWSTLGAGLWCRQCKYFPLTKG